MQKDTELYQTKNLFFKPLIVKTEGGIINIKENNVFHVNVYLMSEGGEINIGSYNIFEDKVIIFNKSKTQPMNIGSFNHFKEGSRIQSSMVGNYNEFGCNSHTQKCHIGTGNIIGALTKMKPTPTKWKQKTVALNGLIQDNKQFDESVAKKMIFFKIKTMHKVYKQDKNNRVMRAQARQATQQNNQLMNQTMKK